jgi:splicing factor 3B subunit 3
MRQKFLGTKAVNLTKVEIEGKNSILAVSNKPYLCYSYLNSYCITPMCYQSLDSACSFSTS